MRVAFLAIVALSLPLVRADFASGQDVSSKKPNIVFILADDAGYGDFGFSGHPYARTPALDKLAKQGTLFKNFYVGGATCCPSRTSLMTGRFTATFPKYPAQHGFSGAVTVTELLHRLGYRTGHFGKWHMGPEQQNGTFGIDDIKVSGGNRKDPRGRDARITDDVIEFLGANKGQPFFVNIWFHTPHNPVNPPQSFVDRFKLLKVNPGDFKGTHMEDYLAEQKKAGEDIDKGMKERLGDLSQLDDQVARLLKALDDLGLSENTIVVFTSDNGPNAYGFAGLFRGRKHNLYDGGVHLPMIVRWPGRVAAGRVDEKSVLAGVDWLPTLCRITGAKIEAKDAEKLVGEDVSDIWLGKERERKQDLFWRTSNPKAPAVILRGAWKLHQVRKGPVELYDLAKDPGERSNIADRHPAVVRDLTAALNRWTATLPKTYTGSDTDKNE